jgi:serine/threonine-protein kinase
MLADLAAVIEDPARSTERAKITGPRKKIPKRGSLPVAVWVGAISLVVIALVVTVNFLWRGSPAKQGGGAAPADAAVHVDAPAPPPPAVDAEQLKMVKLTIVTEPPGATIVKDGVPQGETPTTVEVVDKEKDVKFSLQLDGFEDYGFTVNPKEKLPKNNTFNFTLKKPPKGVAPPVHRPIGPANGSGSGAKAGSGTGSGTAPGGGEIPPDPFAGSAAPRR